MSPTPEVVFASADATVTSPAGVPISVRRGSHWLASDPLVQAQPSLFTTDPTPGLCSSVSVSGEHAGIIMGGVEQATANPGERRVRSRAEELRAS